MSKQNKDSRVHDYPLKADGSVDFEKMPKDENGMDEIDRLAEEAYQNGELKGVDMLGNEEVVEPIMDELFTGHEKPLEAYNVLSVVKHLQGRVLTVLDATFTDEKRIKYVKDLVKECFSASSNWLYEMSLRDFEKVGKHGMSETITTKK
jgi:hypothetical protein